MFNIRKSWNALLEFGSEWRKEDNLPFNFLQKIFQEEIDDLTTIDALVVKIGVECIFTNADKNNWIQGEFHEFQKIKKSNEEKMEFPNP